MQTHAGDFRHRIQIQRSQKVQEHGYTKDMFLPYKNVWAKANNLYGNEKWAAAEYDAERTVIFTIRKAAIPDLSLKDRIKFRSKLYNIRFIDEVLFRNDLMKVTAVAEEEGGGNV